ncbi:hypothetical protein BU14_0172s0020 [Porphyra umbilicalis]|uniref:Uncharacterized protein n=1 Tax=Porphyra umbilicalis TaxID=2786 RepID=A0A1X6P7K5_PORUM|nr:hypothetical protein BU14_0172s0020 [Porphyra umbilicalis]|eukprot:OSX76838.1 hypothetical protein BU14_0172s0020 [Porphyra umbilicalis]
MRTYPCHYVFGTPYCRAWSWYDATLSRYGSTAWCQSRLWSAIPAVSHFLLNDPPVGEHRRARLAWPARGPLPALATGTVGAHLGHTWASVPRATVEAHSAPALRFGPAAAAAAAARRLRAPSIVQRTHRPSRPRLSPSRRRGAPRRARPPRRSPSARGRVHVPCRQLVRQRVHPLAAQALHATLHAVSTGGAPPPLPPTGGCRSASTRRSAHPTVTKLNPPQSTSAHGTIATPSTSPSPPCTTPTRGSLVTTPRDSTRTTAPASSAASRAAPAAADSPTSKKPCGKPHVPAGGAVRRTRSTREPSGETATTPTTGLGLTYATRPQAASAQARRVPEAVDADAKTVPHAEQKRGGGGPGRRRRGRAAHQSGGGGKKAVMTTHGSTRAGRRRRGHRRCGEDAQAPRTQCAGAVLATTTAPTPDFRARIMELHQVRAPDVRTPEAPRGYTGTPCPAVRARPTKQCVQHLAEKWGPCRTDPIPDRKWGRTEADPILLCSLIGRTIRNSIEDSTLKRATCGSTISPGFSQSFRN